MHPDGAIRSLGVRALQLALLCATFPVCTVVSAAANPVEIGELRKGVYDLHGEHIRIKLPPALGRDVWKRVRIQPIDATHWLKRSAGVSKLRVSRGRSFSRLAMALSVF